MRTCEKGRIYGKHEETQFFRVLGRFALKHRGLLARGLREVALFPSSRTGISHFPAILCRPRDREFKVGPLRRCNLRKPSGSRLSSPRGGESPRQPAAALSQKAYSHKGKPPREASAIASETAESVYSRPVSEAKAGLFRTSF